jgi:hypothetical protein
MLLANHQQQLACLLERSDDALPRRINIKKDPHDQSQPYDDVSSVWQDLVVTRKNGTTENLVWRKNNFLIVGGGARRRRR